MNLTPTNELERLLLQAAHDPAARPRFCQLLLESHLFVLVPPNTAPHGERTLEENEKVPLVSWKKGEQDIIPIFTSLPILQETIKTGGQALDYLTMRGKDLFGILGSGTIPAILNPNCPAGKEFFVQEMRDLASGKFFGIRPTRHVIFSVDELDASSFYGEVAL
jgi:SseB protein N-terminal domain